MIDTFLSTDACVERLLAEYHLHGKLIVAFDFDDTVFDYHGKGRTYERVLELLRRCQKLGFWLVLFTACDPNKRDDQRAYLAQQGIQIHSINENPIPLPFGHHGKIYFNVLLDDRAGLGQAVETLTRVLDRVEVAR